MLCYFVIIDVVELVVNKCSNETHLDYSDIPCICECITKMGL